MTGRPIHIYSFAAKIISIMVAHLAGLIRGQTIHLYLSVKIVIWGWDDRREDDVKLLKIDIAPIPALKRGKMARTTFLTF